MENGSDEEGSDEDGSGSEEEDYIIKGEDMIFNPESGLRNWLKSRGKEHCIEF